MTRPDTVRVPLAEIEIGERIGFLNAEHVNDLAERMDAEGQHTPIQLKRNGNAAKIKWSLVAGLHRMLAAKSLGWTEIEAIKVADAKSTADQLRRLELGENLAHRFRRPIERAIMMFEFGRLEEAIDHPGHVGESRHARGARMKNSASVTMTEMEGWRERTAKAFGTSLSTLERHSRIYRAIAEALPELAQQLNDHPMGESLSVMTTVASVKMPDTRRRVVEMILTRPDWKSMDEVMVAMGHRSTGSRTDPNRPDETQFRHIWRQMSAIQRRSHFLDLAKDIPPYLVREAIDKLQEMLP